MQISKKANEIPEALSVYINNLVYAMRRRGDNVKVLSLGEAYFDLPAFPLSVEEFKRGYHYSESRGLPELREVIASYYEKRYHSCVDPDKELLISAGSKPLIYMAFQTVLEPGEQVLIHEPAWLSYPEEIKLAGGEPVFIPYHCPIYAFKNYITKRTRMIVLNNPNNPSGKLYPEDELRELYQLCRDRDIYILADEAYSDFIIDQPFPSMARIAKNKEGVIVVNSLSKNLGISGWRLGYAIADQRVIYAMLKLNQHLITCPATVLSIYAAKYFHQMQEAAFPQVRKVVEKRKQVADYVKEIGLTLLNGSATFYIFVHIGNYSHTSLEVALYLLAKYRIAVVPGSAYGKSTDRFIRISVGTECMKDIQDSLHVIRQVIEKDEYDRALIDQELKSLGIGWFMGVDAEK